MPCRWKRLNPDFPGTCLTSMNPLARLSNRLIIKSPSSSVLCPPSCTASHALTLKLIPSSAPELRFPTSHHCTLSCPPLAAATEHSSTFCLLRLPSPKVDSSEEDEPLEYAKPMSLPAQPLKKSRQSSLPGGEDCV